MYQSVIIVGNVGVEPSMRYTPSGQAVTNFSVAVDESYKNAAGEKVKKTIWYKVAAWGTLAEACNQYVKKGGKVLVQGRMEPDPSTGGPKVWTKQDGTASASFDLTAQVVRFLSSRGESAVETAVAMGGEVQPDDDTPF